MAFQKTKYRDTIRWEALPWTLSILQFCDIPKYRVFPDTCVYSDISVPSIGAEPHYARYSDFKAYHNIGVDNPPEWRLCMFRYRVPGDMRGIAHVVRRSESW
jgi:hypothetical protein